ncbi:hypothetical protein AB0N07_24900 [Streptomyces sp. NPDC051172]|uniref:hypothetical protein n=1 Tax=Streptomyces sp. NPDC051172 TaxID=3155796 RepID=UPI0034439B99
MHEPDRPVGPISLTWTRTPWLQPSRKRDDALPKKVTVTRRAWLMTALAATGFAANVWAWALLSPLGPGSRTAWP